MNRPATMLLFALEIGLLAATDAQAATLALVSQHGFFHVSCRLEYDDGTVKWRSFGPERRVPLADGHVWDTAGDDLVDTYVLFKIDDAVLRAAESATVAEYRSETYNVATRNCIDFARSLASRADLEVGDRSAAETPGEFVSDMAGRNAFLARDDRPLRWLRDTTDPAMPGKLVVHRIVCHKTESVTTRDNIYLLVVTAAGRKFESRRKRINNDETWETEFVIDGVSAGQPICLQIWDDDTIDADDCVFDFSFHAQPGRREHKQTRGTSANASESRYTITWSFVGD